MGTVTGFPGQDASVPSTALLEAPHRADKMKHPTVGQDRSPPLHVPDMVASAPVGFPVFH